MSHTQTHQLPVIPSASHLLHPHHRSNLPVPPPSIMATASLLRASHGAEPHPIRVASHVLVPTHASPPPFDARLNTGAPPQLPLRPICNAHPSVALTEILRLNPASIIACHAGVRWTLRQPPRTCRVLRACTAHRDRRRAGLRQQHLNTNSVMDLFCDPMQTMSDNLVYSVSPSPMTVMDVRRTSRS